MNNARRSKRSVRFVIGGLGRGGAETHLTKVLPHLVQRGWNVTIYTYSEEKDLAPYLAQNGVNVVLLYSAIFSFLPSGLRRVLRFFRTVFLMASHFWRVRADITHFFLPEAYVVGMIACFLSFDRSIRIMSRRSLNHYQYRHHKVFRYLERSLHRHCDFILGNSREIIHQLQNLEQVPISKLGLIYNGIEFESIEPVKRSTKLDGATYPRTLTLVIVANLIPYKGHRDLLQALALIKDKMPPEWILRVVGEDRGIKDELIQFAKNLQIEGHIIWMGKRSDVASILAQSDIGLLCSHEEGFANAILEGMAAGLPMIVTDVGGNAEAVDDGKNGLVVPAASPEMLADAILRLSGNADLRLRMGAEGVKKTQAQYTLSACVARYESVYTSLLQGISPRREESQQVVSA